MSHHKIRKSWIALAATLFLLQGTVEAHFVWVYCELGKTHVVFGEGPEPGEAKFLDRMKRMKATVVVNGTVQALEFSEKVDGDEGWMEAPSANNIQVECPYGIFSRGEKTMFLNYSAKYMRLDNATGTSTSTASSRGLSLDLVPKVNGHKIELQALYRGKPVDGVEIVTEAVDWYPADNLTTGATGAAQFAPALRYVFRAKHVVNEPGNFEGTDYTSQSYYCTLVLDLNHGGVEDSVALTPSDDASKGFALRSVDAKIPDFPKAMTSFGATVVDGKVFVIGGKSGRAHSYARAYQNRKVFCLDLNSQESNWEVVGDNLGLQGLAIVGHGGKVYRIGGLEARNAEGEDQDLHSVADFLEFDPATKEWRALASLPEPRSSLDACVVGDRVYVMGGWELAGEDGSIWANSMLSYDFTNPEKGWTETEVPFDARAMMATAHEGKIFVIGGITESDGTTNGVHVFDPATQKWSKGPQLPIDDRMRAFGCAAISIANELLVSTHDGGIYRLVDDHWEKVHELDSGRFFHHMLPVSKNRFGLFGGSHMGNGSQVEVEVFEVQTGSKKRVASLKE